MQNFDISNYKLRLRYKGKNVLETHFKSNTPVSR